MFGKKIISKLAAAKVAAAKVATVFTLFAAIFICSCKQSSVPVVSVNLSADETNGVVGVPIELYVEVLPSNAQYREVSIVAVRNNICDFNQDEDGIWHATAKETGATKIRASVDGVLSNILLLKFTDAAKKVIYHYNGTAKEVAVASDKLNMNEIFTPTSTAQVVFSGWYLDSDCTNPVTYPYTLTGTDNFYAKWDPVETIYTISFDSNAGDASSADPMTGKNGQTINLPSVTRPGYTFIGWFTDSECTSAVANPFTIIGNATFYAKWQSIEVPFVEVSSVTIGSVKSEYTVGDADIKLRTTVLPEEATNPAVSFVSSAPDVATVSANGTVHFVAAGNATITATAGSKSATVSFTVKEKAPVDNPDDPIDEPMDVKPTAITISSSSVKITEGSSKKLTVAFTPSNTTLTNVLWSSSNEAVATVAGGIVSARSAGSATITVTSVAAPNVSANCTINVEAKADIPSYDGDGIKVHAKYPYVHYWEDGAQGTPTKMIAESNGWYYYEFQLTSVNLLFARSNITAGDWNDKTPDLKISEKGEYWYSDGKFVTSNPDDFESPVLVSVTPSKTVSITGIFTISISATDDINLAKAIISIDGTENAVDISGKEDNVNVNVDTAPLKNGTHSVEVYVTDGAGNVSETKSFTSSNENLPPVAVINGSARMSTGKEKVFTGDSSYDPTVGGTIRSYKWTISGATILNGATTSKVTVRAPEAAGSFTLTLEVTDDEGATSTYSKTVEVKETSVATGDFRDESIYFLMTTRFYDGDPSNNEYCWDEGGEYLKFGTGDCAWRGDFKGLAEKLDYIKALGFSAIWITPVVENASGIDYHGYHAYDFSKVDPRYESAGFTYQNLIDACHEKGIKVIQDIVLNHSGNFGEKNLFHMFDKETTPYVNKDIPTPAGGKRSPFMKLATDGNAYNKLMAGLSMAGGSDYDNEKGSIQYGARINAMKEDSIDTDFIYHHAKMIDWNSENCQLGQMAGDCVDLNTENPTVFNYLKDCYTNYIEMGVDGFRIDTVKHISRYTFNKEFIPAFMEAGGENFYIFGETCARYRGRWNEGVPALSPSFYTWKENKDFAWSQSDHTVNSASASAHFATYKSGYDHPAWADGIANHLLNGNDYHTPDWSMRSHLDQIDFPMHWAFSNAPDAFRTAVGTNDPDFNDATWNVVYVDSHDYAPDNAPEGQRYSKTDEWPRNMNLMFTFRGIPCIYYGSEIMFMAGAPIDPANPRTSLDKSGRAYFGDYLAGTVTASDFGTYTASGKVAETLNHDLAQHVIRLNQIRRAIPALRKGQYSTAGCEGGISFKRRYTDENVDSFVLVAIGDKATFTGVPAGEYIEVVTGKTVNCTGSLTSDSIGKDNMRVYVLKTSTCEVDGKIGKDGAYLN